MSPFAPSPSSPQTVAPTALRRRAAGLCVNRRRGAASKASAPPWFSRGPRSSAHRPNVHNSPTNARRRVAIRSAFPDSPASATRAKRRPYCSFESTPRRRPQNRRPVSSPGLPFPIPHSPFSIPHSPFSIPRPPAPSPQPPVPLHCPPPTAHRPLHVTITH